MADVPTSRYPEWDERDCPMVIEYDVATGWAKFQGPGGFTQPRRAMSEDEVYWIARALHIEFRLTNSHPTRTVRP